MVEAGVRPLVERFFRMAVWYRYGGVGCWILFVSVVELFIWGGHIYRHSVLFMEVGTKMYLFF